MKFLKKLTTFILVVLVIAAIFAIVIAMNWELFSAMPQQMERMQGAATCSTLIFVSVQGKAKPASDVSSVQWED